VEQAGRDSGLAGFLKLCDPGESCTELMFMLPFVSSSPSSIILSSKSRACEYPICSRLCRRDKLQEPYARMICTASEYKISSSSEFIPHPPLSVAPPYTHFCFGRIFRTLDLVADVSQVLRVLLVPNPVGYIPSGLLDSVSPDLSQIAVVIRLFSPLGVVKLCIHSSLCRERAASARHIGHTSLCVSL
jgi:hypothetical protein